MDSSEGQRQGHVQFIVSNAAHPQRPPLTPEDVYKLFHNNGMPPPDTGKLGDRKGLNRVCGYRAEFEGFADPARGQGSM